MYDYAGKQELCETTFTEGGSSLFWLPKIVSKLHSITIVLLPGTFIIIVVLSCNPLCFEDYRKAVQFFCIF